MRSPGHRADAVPGPALPVRKASFAPVVDQHVRVLVLGSLPGGVSLARSQYYAHPRNAFWPLMAAVTGSPLTELAYDDRLRGLLARGVGLWDVVAHAQRNGSLDADIREHAANDLVGMLGTMPCLAAIAFNGGTAARIGLKALGDHADRYRTLTLPSSSPAYTLAYADKLAAWRALECFIA
jgi:hypoxanthine-DNA glycosylase